MNTVECLTRLESFKGFKNWDSYDGLPISEEAIDKAKGLLNGLFVIPTSSGCVEISLGNEEIIILILTDGSVVISYVSTE